VEVQTLERPEPKRHGRIDQYSNHQFTAPRDLPLRAEWKKFLTIGVAIRISTHGDQETYDVRYYISSLPLDVKLFANASEDTGRSHDSSAKVSERIDS